MNQKPLFLTVTLTALLVIGGVFWTMQKRQVAVNQPVVTDPVIETLVQIEPENPVDTSDWKIYTNDTYNFSFKYPKDWIMEEYPDKLGLFLRSPETRKIQSRKNNYGYPMDLTVKFFSSLKDYDCVGICSNTSRNYEDVEKYLLEDPFNYFDVGRILINEKPAVETVIGGNLAEYGVFIENNRNIYLIKFGTAENKSALSEEQKGILKTFHITKK